jgi:ectoine hydroxylase-related dioxygenase (phytanoyl-CoA dioxygenase family)
MTSSSSSIQELSKQFNEEGYLLLKDVLSADKVARLNAVIDEILAEEPESLSYNIYNSVERHEEIASLMDQPLVLPLIAQLLGYNIQLHISHLTVRKPNPDNLHTATNSFINWHQDGPHPQFPTIDGLTSTYYIKACYILSDMSKPDRGNTKIIPRSHNRVYEPNSDNVRDKLPDEIQICGKPGDVFIFPQNLWHAGAPNHSDQTRRQLFLGYSPIWMRPIDYTIPSERLLNNANPIRKQLLGIISENPFNYYVPDDSMVPLKQMSQSNSVDAKSCV